MADETRADGVDDGGAAPPPVGPRGGNAGFRGGVPWEGGTPEGLRPTAPAWSTHSALPPAGYGVGPPPGMAGGMTGPPFTSHGYGYAAGMAGMPRDHPEGTKVLVLGVLGITICGLCAPFAWVAGNRALRHIDSSPGLYTNRSAVVTGRILGIVGSVMMLVSIPMALFFIALSFAGTTAGSGY